MKIKLLRDWDGHKAGSILETDEETAKALVLAETAVEFDEAAEKAAEDRDAAVKSLVQEAVASALEGVKAPSLNLHVEVSEREAPVYRSLGEQLADVKAAGSGQRPERLQKYMAKAATGASEIVDADGGYLVQEDFLSALFEASVQESNLQSRASTTEVSGNGLRWNEVDKYNRTAGNRPVSVYRTAEAGTKTASKPSFLPRSLQLQKLAGLFYATDELLEDASALDSEVRGWFTEEFAFVGDNEMIRGTGAGQMLGILNAPCLVTVAKSGARTANTLSTDITNMFARMYPAGIPRAEWFINSALLPYLMRMEVASTPVYLPPNGLIDAPAGMLLGRPVNIIEQASALASVGDIMFCDWSQYKIIRKAGGIKADVSIHVRFVNDETAFRFVVRNNGAPVWSKYLTPAQGSATQGPFITLGA